MVYVDASRPELVDGFTRKTFTAMIAGVREPALRRADRAERFDEGIAAISRRPRRFCYTFFKGDGRAW